MATDVRVVSLPSPKALREYLDEHDIHSSDILHVMSYGNKITLVYTPPTDASAPQAAFVPIPNQQDGAVVKFYVGVSAYSGLAVSDNPSTVGLIFYWRNSSLPMTPWKAVRPKKISDTLYLFEFGPVRTPIVQWYLVTNDTEGNKREYGNAMSPHSFTVS